MVGPAGAGDPVLVLQLAGVAVRVLGGPGRVALLRLVRDVLLPTVVGGEHEAVVVVLLAELRGGREFSQPGQPLHDSLRSVDNQVGPLNQCGHLL